MTYTVIELCISTERVFIPPTHTNTQKKNVSLYAKMFH